MATKMSRSTKAVTTEEVVEEKPVEKKKTVRKFENDDPIACRSMVNGPLFITGLRTKFTYDWADYGDVRDVDYQDLIQMVRSPRDVSIYEPRIIVEDEEFIAQNPKLQEFYDSLYTTADLKEILSLTPNEMRSAIEGLSSGAKETFKGIVADMIDTNRLDSVQKIKVIDEIFDTNFLLIMAQN